MAEFVRLQHAATQFLEHCADETLARGQAACQTTRSIFYASLSCLSLIAGPGARPSPFCRLHRVLHQHGDGQQPHAPGTGV